MENHRQSNFELCRLAAILLVITVHTTHWALGTNVSFGVHLLAGFSLIGVNVFILITGYFSATPKAKSLINLAFICLFWMIARIGCKYYFLHSFNFSDFFFVTRSNWFIPSYIVLLFFAPILNVFCNSVNKRYLLGVITALLFLVLWFDWLPPTPRVKIGAQNGYSVLSFMIIYLIGRFIRLHGLPDWLKRISPLVYIVCSVITALLVHISVGTGSDRIVNMFRAYDSPIIILSSVTFLMIFERIKIQSPFVNHIARSTLACLFGQMVLGSLYSSQFKYLYEYNSGWQLVGYWALSIAIVFISSIFVDQLRLILWKPINCWLDSHLNKNSFIKYGI